MSEDYKSTLAAKMSAMKPRGKEPYSAGVLDSWIDHAETGFGISSSGRIRWLIASTVITAMLQQIVDEYGVCRFSLKGGTLLQHRYGLASRATKDIDGVIRGDIDVFLRDMDEQFKSGNWGSFEFSRSEVTEIRVPGKTINPRQFDVVLSIKGKTWRKIKVEISPDEGMAGSNQESFQSPSLEGFGLPTPERLVGMAMCYQAAQKIHGATDLHKPEEGYRNDRPRDVVDLVLIGRISEATGSPTLQDIRGAVVDIFSARANDAKATGRLERIWPAKVTQYEHWGDDYAAAARSVGLRMTLEEAITYVNAWLKEIEAAK